MSVVGQLGFKYQDNGFDVDTFLPLAYFASSLNLQ